MGSAEEIIGIGASFYREPSVAEAYSARPDYPVEAMEYLLQSTTFDMNDGLALDAGCGNGGITRGLVAAGVKGQIIAMDQSEPMIAALRGKVPERVVRLVGDFNATQLPDHTVGLAVFGSAIHWGDDELLPGELHRILHPGGFVASVSNVTRAGTEFTAILDEIPDHAARVNSMTADPGSIQLGKKFDPVGCQEFKNNAWLTPGNFNNLLRSIEVLKDHREGSDIWNRLQDYAVKKTSNGLVLVEFDTFVRISRTKIIPVGGVACQNTVGI